MVLKNLAKISIYLWLFFLLLYENANYSENKADENQLANLKYGVDTILTSPPFENKEPFEDKTFKLKGEQVNADYTYTQNKGDLTNLPNLSGKTYLNQVLLIYEQCFKVLKGKHFKCDCGYIQYNDRQELHSGIHRWGRVHKILQDTSPNNNWSDRQETIGNDSRAIQGMGSGKNIFLQKQEELETTSIKYEGLCTDSESVKGFVDSQKSGGGGISGGSEKTAQEFRVFEQGECNSAEEIGTPCKANCEILQMLDTENCADIARSRNLWPSCEKCKTDIREKSGLLIIHTKNFTRKGVQVRLDEDTRKLCELVGFKKIEHVYVKLAGYSFWIRNARKKWFQKNPGKVSGDPFSYMEDVQVFVK